MSFLIDPLAMRLSARPGHNTHGDFVLQGPFSAGTLVATLNGNSTVLQLREFVATAMIEEDLTPDEIAQLPPAMRKHPPSGIRFEEFSRAKAGQPLAVKAGVQVHGIIDCRAPDGPSATHRATLTIEGPNGQKAQMPVTFVGGAVEIEFPASMSVRQGRSAQVPVLVSLPGAPTTELILEVSHGFIELAPTAVQVPEARAVNVLLMLSTPGQAPLGPQAALLTVKGHSQLLDFIPFEVTVVEPPPPPQVDRQAVVARIHDSFRRLGGLTGQLGFPTGEVQFSGHTAVRQFRGGEVRAQAQFDEARQIGVVTQALAIPGVRVVFVGFRCVRKASSDGLSSANEPYFVVSVVNGDGQARVQKFGPFENVQTGSELGVGAALLSGAPPNPTNVLVLAYENDRGDANETARRLQEKATEVAQEVQSLLAASAAGAADGPGLGTSAAVSAIGGLFAGPIGGLLAGAAVQAFGLDDDAVGQDTLMLFQREQDVGDKEPIGKFRGKPFNERLMIDGGEEGSYELFFDVVVEVNERHPVRIPGG